MVVATPNIVPKQAFVDKKKEISINVRKVMSVNQASVVHKILMVKDDVKNDHYNLYEILLL